MIFAYLLSEDGNGTEDTDDIADGSNQTNNRWSVKTGKNLKQQKKTGKLDRCKWAQN